MKEAEVIRLIVEGISYAEIANRTKVAVSTIKKIKRRNLDDIRLMEWPYLEQLELMRAKANQLLLLWIEMSEKDQRVLSDLNGLYGRGEISHREYMKRKRYLKILTTNQVAAILNRVNGQLSVSSK